MMRKCKKCKIYGAWAYYSSGRFESKGVKVLQESSFVESSLFFLVENTQPDISIHIHELSG